MGKSFILSFDLIVAVSTPEADLAYGYILFNYEDLSPGDESVRKALGGVWRQLCGKEESLEKETRWTVVGD